MAELEQHLSRYTARMAFLPIISAKAHYILGMAYDKSGWMKKAIERYEEFLHLWKDADPGIEDVEDAKARLARLESVS